MKIDEVIRKTDKGYVLYSKSKGKDGERKRLGGPYKSRSGAEKRERQVQAFKHMGEEKEHPTHKNENFADGEEIEYNLNENALKALRFATAAHKGQMRKSGDPYISHPKEVARFVKQFKQSNNLSALIQAAYLHDTIEDTDTTHEDLVKQFGGLVADMVQELTSDKEAIQALGKGEYIAGKMAKMSSWALVVKLADRLANVQDIDSRPAEFQRRYAAQTKQAIDRLRTDRYLSATHNKIISAIEDKIKEYLEPEVAENFADGKVKGKSRPGRVKRAGASCKDSVTGLRAKAKKYGGEKGKMYHWCANMKSGKQKK